MHFLVECSIATLDEWLANDTDSLALRDCVEAYAESPSSGIPSRRVRKPDKVKLRDDSLLAISQLWSSLLDGKAASLWDALSKRKDENTLYSKLFTVFNELKVLRADDKSPSDFISRIIKELAPWNTVSSLLEEVDSWVETSERSDGGKGRNIALMTFQGAKGLEADVVCVIGVEEGQLPKPTQSDEELAEQSRLMFVTMTRAKEKLHLFYARNRSAGVVLRQVHSKGKPPNINPSRFIEAIPQQHRELAYHSA